MVTNEKRVKFGPLTVRFVRNPYGKRGSRFNKPGWQFTVHVGKGAGYRWIDLPGHSNNIADGWRCRYLYIPGVTFTVGHNMREIMSRRNRNLWISFRRNGNPKCVPAWW